MEKCYISTKQNINVIGELFTGRQESQLITGETGICAFAPDESRFAWSCGSRKLVIIPWDRYKTSLYSEENQKTAVHQIVSERIAIDCGFLVCSVAFGVGTPVQDIVECANKTRWTRFDFSKDLTLATGHINGRIRIWDSFNGKLLLELTDHRFPVHSLAFAFDGSLRLASGCQDGSVKIWDMADDGNMFKTFVDSRKAPVRELCWSPDSKYLCVVGLKRKVELWNMDDYELHKRLVGHVNDVNACSFSPDGAVLATASSDTRVIIWDTATGTVQKILNHMIPPPGQIYMAGANDFFVRGVAFSPNGLQLASTCLDGCLRIWDLTDEDSDEPEALGLGIPDDQMLSCTYTPAGGSVAICFASGSTVFYSVPSKIPSLRHICRMVVRKSLGRLKDELFIPRTLCNYLDYKEW